MDRLRGRGDIYTGCGVSLAIMPDLFPYDPQGDLFWQKSNLLIRSRNDFDKTTDLLITLLAQQVDPMAEDMPVCTVNASEVFYATGGTNKATWSRVMESAEKLLDTKFEIIDPEREEYLGVNLFEYVHARKSTIRARFTREMRPYILHRRKNYTPISVRAMGTFRSLWARRIYQMCRQFLDTGIFVVTVDRLRAELKLEDKYAVWADFRRRVLETAISEFEENEFCEFTAQMRLHKRRTGQVYKITFHIRKKETPQTVHTPQSVHTPQTVHEDLDDRFELWVETNQEEFQERLAEALDAVRAQLDLNGEEPDPAQVSQRAMARILMWFYMDGPGASRS